MQHMIVKDIHGFYCRCPQQASLQHKSLITIVKAEIYSDLGQIDTEQSIKTGVPDKEVIYQVPLKLVSASYSYWLENDFAMWQENLEHESYT